MSTVVFLFRDFIIFVFKFQVHLQHELALQEEPAQPTFLILKVANVQRSSLPAMCDEPTFNLWWCAFLLTSLPVCLSMWALSCVDCLAMFLSLSLGWQLSWSVDGCGGLYCVLPSYHHLYCTASPSCCLPPAGCQILQHCFIFPGPSLSLLGSS